MRRIASVVQSKSIRLLLALTITAVGLGTALAVGPNQQAALDRCKGTFEEQKKVLP
jgi:hypothetical protein